MVMWGLNGLSVVFELLIYYFFFHLFFGSAKYSKITMVIIYFVVGIISLLLSQMVVAHTLLKEVGYFAVIISLSLCYQGKTFIKVFVPFLFQTLSMMIESCWALILHEPTMLWLQNSAAGRALYYLMGMILSNLTIMLLVWLGYACKCFFYKNSRYGKVSFPGHMIVLFLFPICMMYILDQYCALVMSVQKVSFKAIAPILMLTALIVLFFFVSDFFNRYQYEHKRLAVLENQMALEREYHEILLSKHQQFQGLRHDMQAHLDAIASLINSHHYTEALEYAQSQAGKLATVAVVQTGHPLLDTILTIKKEQAQQHVTTFECYCSAVMPDLTIAIDDLASLLDNILSNALEAMQDIEEISQRKITCQLVQEKGYLHIVVCNSVQNDVEIIDNIIPTTKANRAAHGWGLSNVRQIVKKYQGIYSLQCVDNIFTVKVILPT